MRRLKIKTITRIKEYTPKIIREPVQNLIGRKIYHPIYDELKCIYIHIPKTAGTSVSMSLFGSGTVGHWSAETYNWTNEKKYEEYFKFTFVRNPWDRLVSAYYYLIQGGKNKSDHLWAIKNISKYNSFNSFVNKWVSKESIQTWGHFRPQTDFIILRGSCSSINYIGRFENLTTDFNHICQQLKATSEILKLNSSIRPAYQDIYTKKSADKIANIYMNDIEQFNYKFD